MSINLTENTLGSFLKIVHLAKQGKTIKYDIWYFCVVHVPTKKTPDVPRFCTRLKCSSVKIHLHPIKNNSLESILPLSVIAYLT